MGDDDGGGTAKKVSLPERRRRLWETISVYISQPAAWVVLHPAEDLFEPFSSSQKTTFLVRSCAEIPGPRPPIPRCNQASDLFVTCRRPALHIGTPHTQHASPIATQPNGTSPIADVEPTASAAPEATGRVRATTDILTYILSYCVEETSNFQLLARVVCSLVCLFRIAPVVSHPHGGAQTHRSPEALRLHFKPPKHTTNGGYVGAPPVPAASTQPARSTCPVAGNTPESRTPAVKTKDT